MKLYALIVAGGSGIRMGTDIPKQFLPLGGRPVLMHTIEKFRNFSSEIEIITVLPGSQIRYWIELQEKHSFRIIHTVVKGGHTRFHSVRNGLAFATGTGLVAIHDGVRPLVTPETIKRCFDRAAETGNAIPVVSPSESLRQIEGDSSFPLDRSRIRLIQTPQVFDIDLIKEAYMQEYIPEFTDDATVLERTGMMISLVEGDRNNIKITTPEDLVIAGSLLRGE